MLGFSVYLGNTLDKDYILKMVSIGYDTIFTSLQIPEENKQNQLAYLGELCQLLSSFKITYIIDVNPSLLNQTLYSYLNQFTYGNFIIRIDDQLNIQLIQEVQHHGFQCCLNASNITSEMLNLIYQHDDQTQLLYCHNYYPRPDTGLSYTFIERKNQLIQTFDKHANIYAFIPGSKLRAPLYKGLPTIEQHRSLHPLVAAQELQSSGISHIIISDTAIDLYSAQLLFDMIRHRHFTLHLKELDTSFSKRLLTTHTSRIDAPEHIIRSQYSRMNNNTTIQPVGTSERKKGDVTIDNQFNGRYEGEIQVIKTALEGHSNINHIATISDEDLQLLTLIQPGDTFKFTYTKENDNEPFNNRIPQHSNNAFR